MSLRTCDLIPVNKCDTIKKIYCAKFPYKCMSFTNNIYAFPDIVYIILKMSLKCNLKKLPKSLPIYIY